jgi:GNAT superfamily N-acetyltransferase
MIWREAFRSFDPSELISSRRSELIESTWHRHEFIFKGTIETWSEVKNWRTSNPWLRPCYPPRLRNFMFRNLNAEGNLPLLWVSHLAVDRWHVPRVVGAFHVELYRGNVFAAGTWVDPQYRRAGIALALWRRAFEIHAAPIHVHTVTPAGAAFVQYLATVHHFPVIEI